MPAASKRKSLGRPKKAGEVFDSLPGAAAHLKVEAGDLRAAKAAGCPAFRNGKVYIGELKKWLKEHPTEEGEQKESEASLKKRRLRAQCERLEFEFEELRGLYAMKSEVAQRIRELRLAEWSELRQVFERELPAICDGLGAAAIQRNNADALARIAAGYQKKAEKCTG